MLRHPAFVRLWVADCVSVVGTFMSALALPSANARLTQSYTVGESTGPALAGVLVRFVGAPVAVLVDAMTYLVSAVVVATTRQPEPAPSTVMTVLVFYAVQDLRLDAAVVGLVLACAGLSGVVGAGLAPRVGDRLGLGRACVLADWLTPVAFCFALAARPGPVGVVLLVLGQLVYGFGGGLKNPLELSYRNAVTPPALRGRMNATIRTFNWGSIAVTAPLAGAAATAWGNRTVIACGIGVLVLSGLVLLLSPFRSAELPDGVDG